ncbi:hypothetical protein ACJRO7_001089 [Eucalyptus globulus]|uniref:Uncharacterized protein n=1 Tax=Eucalyptus globulus TaxID=34317 RepID=A0ABD3LTV2_EUCGL
MGLARNRASRWKAEVLNGQKKMLKTEEVFAVVIFEVQRSAKSEARKEEKRREELEAMRQRDEALEKEVEILKQKLEELEQLAKGRGLSGLFNFKQAISEDAKIAKPV